ncbi:MAG TPA: lactonase family protein [Terriglobales bacterium]|nr:lactonase family protein [Terriglobales bacterium]
MTALLAIVLGLCVPVIGAGEAEPHNYFVYVGTYTEHGSKGVYAYRFDPVAGEFASLGLAVESVEPSFLAIAENGKFLYAVNEITNYNGQPSGAVSAFAIQPRTGKLVPLNQVSSRDAGPAHITLDRSGHYALVSNYELGSVAVFPVLQDGRLGEASAFVRHKGSSVNPERQRGPHAHAVALSPDNRFAVVADLGLDELLVYRFDAAGGSLGRQPQIVKTVPGAGPRHLVFDRAGRFLYLINELQSTVVSYAYDASSGKLRELQTISTLPQRFSGTNEAAEIEIHPSGKFLFASNRGDDSIAVFAVDPKQGTLSLVETDSTGGRTPRHFALDPTGSWLLAANQDSDEIALFHVNPNTGHLTASGQILHIPSPACVKFVVAP